MKGTTNSKLITSLKEIVQLNLTTNQNSSSDLVGATITVEYGGEVKNCIWNGNLINIEIPEGWEYTISVGDVSGYKTPSPVTFTSEGNSVTNVDMQYLTELVTITVTTEDGTSANGSIINCNGTNHTYNGVFTKKFAYGTTYTITPNDFGDYNADPITYTASLTNREVSIIYSSGFPTGTTFEFDYTGSVLSIELKKGTYKLLCWGALGGGSYKASSSAGLGSKGGYSEGVLTLVEPKTLYVFVGGKGSNGSSTSLVNGGWNGGGGSVGYSTSSNGYSYPACGGGATDISTVTSSMTYSAGRTNRTNASLLSRCIVAGGGAGGSTTYEPYYKTDWLYVTTYGPHRLLFDPDNYSPDQYTYTGSMSLTSGTTYGYGVEWDTHGTSNSGNISFGICENGTWLDILGYLSVEGGGCDGCIDRHTAVSGSYKYSLQYDRYSSNTYGDATIDMSLIVYKDAGKTVAGHSAYRSSNSLLGGGTSGRGQYPGTQSAGGNGNGNDGGFGYGGNQTANNYSYTSGGGGSGWYGGGTARSNSSGSYRNYSGGGSGFVNIAANASYRPSGYTGLELNSGTTIDGSQSFEAPNGGTETGHAGNGYARITVL